MAEQINIQVAHGIGNIQEFNGVLQIGSKEKFEPMIDWLKKETLLKIKGVGKRYVPLSGYEQLNIKISNFEEIIAFPDIDFVIDSIKVSILSERFYYSYKFFEEAFNENSTLVYCDSLQKYFPKELIKESLNIKKYLEDFFDLLELNKNKLHLFINNQNVISIVQKISEISRKMNEFRYSEDYKNLKLKVTSGGDDICQRFVDVIYELKYHLLNQFEDILNGNYINITSDINYFVKLKLSSLRTILLTGEALIGKTHLMCDTALNRLNSNQPTVLFFGHEFNDDKSIISNMIRILGIADCNAVEFLEALNKLGIEHNSQTLIIIDAINETENPKLWQNGIIEFCEKIKSYPNLALALSIRDVEKNKLITNENEKYIEEEIVEIRHKGFEGIELEAVQTFCAAFGVEFPKVPIHTNRLFVNPGMLFLYIEIIKETTQQIDTTIVNPTAIFKAYIDNLNKKFSQLYNIDEDDRIVEEAISHFISLGTQQNYTHFYLPQKLVSKEIKSIHEKVLEFLKSEGVLNKLNTNGEISLYFTYQKFENYFIAEYLLSDFEKNKDVIFDLIKNYNRAISEALFVQVTEKLDKEIFDLNVWLIRDAYICELYIDSLIWRHPKLITEKTFKNINFILDHHNYSDMFLNVILQLSTIPNHPLNIERLHKRLLEFQLSERDYHWSIYLHNSYSNDGVVKRIISWAWDKDVSFEINDDSLYLYGLTLGWFLTSSNRLLRDGATKALVNIFTDHVDIFYKVLRKFENVNDSYVLERLYAVGYGITLRSSNYTGFREFGLYIYQTIFDVDFIIEHILLREYASFTVEFINNIVHLNVPLEKIYPPYNQNHSWTLPTIEKSEVQKYQEDFTSIYHSTLVWDFKRYKIYPYANHFLNLKISDRPHKKLPKERYDDFFENLTEEQTRAYDQTRFSSDEILKILNEQVTDINELDELENTDIDIQAIEELKQTKLSQSKFKELLDPEQLKEYNEIVVNYFDRDKNQFNIDLKSIKRLIFLEAIKFGWDKKLFEEFDKSVNKWDRHEHRSERIGKKHQWIALYKVLAQLLDNYEYQNGKSENKLSQYMGTYQFSIRNIDPTTILKEKKQTDTKWWFKVTNEFDNKIISDLEWMNSTDKLPLISDTVDVTYYEKDYLILDMNFSIDGNQDKGKYRNLYYSINSYVIKKDDLNRFNEFAKDKIFYARKMPNANHLHDVYLREYPHSKVYKYFDNDYYSQVSWDDSFDGYRNKLPCQVLLTATAYFNEAKGYDHSVENSIEISLPNKWLIEQMNLQQTFNDGEWINQNDEVLFFDPTVRSGSVSSYNENSVLLADKKLFFEYLEQNAYTLIWVMWGEKQVRETEINHNHDDFLGIAEIDGFAYFDGNKIVDSDIRIVFEHQ